MLRLCLRSNQLNSVFLFQNNLKIEFSSNFSPAYQIIRKFSSKSQNDEKLERIYYGPLTPQIRAVKIFSLGSSIMGFIAQPIIIREATNIGSTSLLVALCSVVGFFTFVTPLLLHLITKKYVTQVFFDPKTSTYKATTLSFFLTEKQTSFKVEDVVVPDIPGMFSTFDVKKQSFFVEARHFSDPMHYAKMMGYDKPMDFKLGDSNEETNK